MFNKIHLFVRASFVMGLIVVLGNLSGCASDAEIAAANGEQGAAAGSATGGEGSGQGATPTGIAIDSRWAGRPIAEILNDSSTLLSQRVFYFGYDSSTIDTADREALTEHAEFLTSHPELTVTIEGHADERGSREYNLALGERRAKGVERLLSLLGAPKSQQQVVSFGEERPTALGHDESAWRFNRRVELLYSGY
ncbi:MAG: peptidoglycan-associated lipoprotein Pal [Gammaproteobacteria bacterium]|nr:peptidoglycan-associated lipoprotein Pal [Gammaproteobacteria bacterium]